MTECVPAKCAVSRTGQSRGRRETQRGFLILRAGMEQEPAGHEMEAVDLARPLVRTLRDRPAHGGPVVGPPAGEPFTRRAGGVVERERLFARHGVAVGPRSRRVGAGVERLDRVPWRRPRRGQQHKPETLHCDSHDEPSCSRFSCIAIQVGLPPLFSGQIQRRVLREFEVFYYAVPPVVEFDFQRLLRTGCDVAEQFGVRAKRRDEAVVEFRLHLFRHVGLGGGPLHVGVRPDLQGGRVADMGTGVVQDEVKMRANLAGPQPQRRTRRCRICQP